MTPGFPAFILLAACLSAAAEDAFKDDLYNMPAAVVAEMGVDAAMTKMETQVTPETLDAFKKAHPSPFWLFGEDRQLAVRNHIVPAHWFEDEAKQFGKFAGVARPGEFYVFQVCVLNGDQQAGRSRRLLPTLEMPGAVVSPISRQAISRDANDLQTLWFGIQIPMDAKPGNYRGTIHLEERNVPKFKGGIPAGTEEMLYGFGPATDGAPLAFTLKVEGEPIPESGTNDAWRLSRLKWLDSEIGESDAEVTRPFTPVRVVESTRTIGLLGRDITLGADGIPTQFSSRFSGSNTHLVGEGVSAFTSPPRFEVVSQGKVLDFKPTAFRFTSKTPVGVEWSATSEGGDMARLTVTGRMEFDGHAELSIHLRPGQTSMRADDIRLVLPYAKSVVKYAMGLGLKGGLAPERLDWNWDVAKHQDAIWLGDTNIGTMLRFKGSNYRRPLINAYYAFQPLNLPESWGSGGVRLDGSTLTAYSGPKEVSISGPNKGSPGGLDFDIDWYFTPFKPLDVEKHFTDRYHHAKQGAPNEDTAKLRAQGANILEVHHNRPCNPYINYPFNDDSFGGLKDFIAKAHADDMRVSVYYTTRELTQNLPEFFALKSLDGEVILPRKEGVPWPVTNSGGPHPWLKQHVGEDIVPAWRENLKFPQYKSSLDLAVITTPDSRWNNFYLEGLNHLVKKAGIDGLYIDDTALDRKSMQRARRILDADGNTGRRVNMHSWNHFNGLAAWANSSIAFMELYPYYDGLWHGEGFNANSSPEFMLVEMSGIPYGLMSEMLDGPNPWHGMLFGMRTRWPWSGDPREQWKFEQSFGIAGSEFIGWWDAKNPVKVGKTDPGDPARVIASVYKKPGKTLIALGNWGAATKIKLTVDWIALSLDPAKIKLHAPEIKGFQHEQTFSPGDEIPVEANRGWLLICEEVPGDH